MEWSLRQGKNFGNIFQKMSFHRDHGNQSETDACFLLERDTWILNLSLKMMVLIFLIFFNEIFFFFNSHLLTSFHSASESASQKRTRDSMSLNKPSKRSNQSKLSESSDSDSLLSESSDSGEINEFDISSDSNAKRANTNTSQVYFPFLFWGLMDLFHFFERTLPHQHWITLSRLFQK